MLGCTVGSTACRGPCGFSGHGSKCVGSPTHTNQSRTTMIMKLQYVTRTSSHRMWKWMSARPPNSRYTDHGVPAVCAVPCARALRPATRHPPHVHTRDHANKSRAPRHTATRRVLCNTSKTEPATARYAYGSNFKKIKEITHLSAAGQLQLTRPRAARSGHLAKGPSGHRAQVLRASPPVRYRARAAG